MIGIASDHKGFKIKQELTNFLNELGYTIIDYGTNGEESTDYPTYAFKIGEQIRDNKINCGILICGTGIGMCIACNKVKKVRCAKVDNLKEAVLAKQHNNANAIAISSDNKDIFEIAKIFLETQYIEEKRHSKRIEMIDNYDN